MNLSEKKKLRHSLLNKIYEETGGNKNTILHFDDDWKELTSDYNEFQSAAQYLQGESLIERAAMGDYFRITHYGVKEMEESLSEPDTPTSHFPPLNVIYVQNMNHSQIQQGNSHSQQTQINTTNNDVSKSLIELLEKFKNSANANETQVELAESYINTLISQSKVPIADRDTGLISKTWDKLSKLSTLVALGEFALKAYPVVKVFFGLP
jgi:hypothetical protein